MRYLAINGHRSKVPFSTWNFLEHNQNSFLGSSWDLYGTIKISGFQGSPKKSLYRHSIVGLKKVSSFRAELMYSLKSGCIANLYLRNRISISVFLLIPTKNQEPSQTAFSLSEYNDWVARCIKSSSIRYVSLKIHEICYRRVGKYDCLRIPIFLCLCPFVIDLTKNICFLSMVWPPFPFQRHLP